MNDLFDPEVILVLNMALIAAGILLVLVARRRRRTPVDRATPATYAPSDLVRLRERVRLADTHAELDEVDDVLGQIVLDQSTDWQVRADARELRELLVVRRMQIAAA